MRVLMPNQAGRPLELRAGLLCLTLGVRVYWLHGEAVV